MVGNVKADEFKEIIKQTNETLSSELAIGTIPITGKVSFNLVYRTDNHNIIQAFFEGLNTDLFLTLDGETKSGLNEYETIINLIKSGSFQQLLEKLPAEITLSDGKTVARFWSE